MRSPGPGRIAVAPKMQRALPAPIFDLSPTVRFPPLGGLSPLLKPCSEFLHRGFPLSRIARLHFHLAVIQQTRGKHKREALVYDFLRELLHPLITLAIRI